MDARLIAAAIPLFFLFIAAERWLTRKRADPAYRLHDSLADLSCGIGQQVLQVFFQAGLLGAYSVVWERWRFATVSPTSPLAWLGLLVAVDVSFYWFHRASHRVNALWAVHAVHHQSEEYNFSVALRQAWLEPVTIAPFHLPLALMGFPPAMFLAGYTLNTLYQFWPHTRGVGKLGRFEWLFNTASHHRVHHAINPEYIDKNYSGMFIVWDRLFGTFCEERAEPAYGTVKPLASFNPLWANVAVWVDLARLAARAPSFVDRLKTPFMPPEWRPTALGGPVVIPAVDRRTQRRYDTQAPRAVERYVVASFATLVVATVGFILAEGAPLARLVVAAALFLASLGTVAGLVEGRRWAVPVEVARLAALPFAAAFLAGGAPFVVAAVAGSAGMAVAFGVGLVFVARARRIAIALARAAEDAGLT